MHSLPPIMLDDDKILIDKEALDFLLKRDEWLSCLEEAGVDNWIGFSDALDIWMGNEPESEDDTQLNLGLEIVE